MSMSLHSGKKGYNLHLKIFFFLFLFGFSKQVMSGMISKYLV